MTDDPGAVIDHALAAFVRHCERLPGELRVVIHFGSTVRRPLKYETDVDLLVIFDRLPDGAIARSAHIEPAEVELAATLGRTLPPDYHIEPSVKLKTAAQFEAFSLLYLDMVECSRILFDVRGDARRILDKTAEWIKKSGARRVQQGLRWYWILGDDVRWDVERQIGW